MPRSVMGPSSLCKDDRDQRGDAIFEAGALSIRYFPSVALARQFAPRRGLQASGRSVARPRRKWGAKRTGQARLFWAVRPAKGLGRADYFIDAGFADE